MEYCTMKLLVVLSGPAWPVMGLVAPSAMSCCGSGASARMAAHCALDLGVGGRPDSLRRNDAIAACYGRLHMHAQSLRQCHAQPAVLCKVAGVVLALPPTPRRLRTDWTAM